MIVHVQGVRENFSTFVTHFKDMSELILKVKNKRKLPFLKELLKQMDFVEVVGKTSTNTNRKEKQLLKDIDEAVDFVNDFKRGTKAKSFNQLLSEL